MKLITAMRLRVMNNAAKEKRLDALNRKIANTHPNKLTEQSKEEMEERDWLKKKLGYGRR